MNAPQSLEAQMQAIVALHGLSHISFGLSQPAPDSLALAFACHMHHEKLPGAAHGVTFGYGDTLDAAYDHAAHNLEAARAAPVAEQAA